MSRHIEPNDSDLQAQIGTAAKPWYKVIASLLFGDASGTTGINTTTQGALDAKADLVGGVVPAAQLPSYVDDVLEYSALANFPETGETGKIYVATNTNLAYRWSGSAYVAISSSIALGETESTAYRGDRGKIAYDHSQITSGNPHTVTKSDVGLANVDNVQQLPLSYLDTDGTMAADSDSRVPSQKAVRTYVAANAGGGSGTRGLFTGLMSAVPTQALTGFSTWVNQGSATVEDSSAGLTLSSTLVESSLNLHMLVKSAPTPPYSVKIIIALSLRPHANYTGACFGWRKSADGKLTLFNMSSSADNASGGYFGIQNWSSYTTWASNLAEMPSFQTIYCLKLSDDGTNITMSISGDGYNFLPIYSIAKSSGYQGASGYNQIFFGIYQENYKIIATIVSYLEGTS